MVFFGGGEREGGMGYVPNRSTRHVKSRGIDLFNSSREPDLLPCLFVIRRNIFSINCKVRGEKGWVSVIVDLDNEQGGVCACAC